MFDAALRPFVDRILNPVGRQLAASGISANQVSVVGFAFGVAAAVAVATGAGLIAALLLAANRLCDGLDGAVARANGPTDLGGFLDITLDFIIYSGIVFAFAVADPANAIAAAFLIFSFVGTGTSFLAFAIIAQKRDISTDIRGKKSFFYLGGLTEGLETIIFLVSVILIPSVFGSLAWVFGKMEI
ncbi:MAG: CDP-alcohol phosphatidyltransferase family protein, partial [Candidatus Puniceispirillaceae bacterium]